MRRAGRGQKKGTPTGVPFTYGAGYGNRTRLCGLGSDRSTDELTPQGRRKVREYSADYVGSVPSRQILARSGQKRLMLSRRSCDRYLPDGRTRLCGSESEAFYR